MQITLLQLSSITVSTRTLLLLAQEGWHGILLVFADVRLTMTLSLPVHVFKRTKPLRNFSVAAGGVHGTVYLGGGAWGAPLAGASTVEGPGVTICSEEVRAADPRVGETGWFTEKASNDFNVFHGVAVLSEDGSMLSLRAFDAENNTLDFVNITA